MLVEVHFFWNRVYAGMLNGFSRFPGFPPLNQCFSTEKDGQGNKNRATSG